MTECNAEHDKLVTNMWYATKCDKVIQVGQFLDTKSGVLFLLFCLLYVLVAVKSIWTPHFHSKVNQIMSGEFWT
jgi:hypothetical protein